MKWLPLRLAALDEILPRQLDGGFDRFRAAADEIGVSQSARLVADQTVGQRLGGLGREEGGMRIGEFRGLLRHRSRERADADARGRKPRRPPMHRAPGGHPRRSATRLRRRSPSAAFRAGFGAARGLSGRSWKLTFLCYVLGGRSEASFGLFQTLLGAGAAQQECRGSERLRDCDRAGQAREKSR